MYIVTKTISMLTKLGLANVTIMAASIPRIRGMMMGCMSKHLICIKRLRKSSIIWTKSVKSIIITQTISETVSVQENDEMLS